MSRRSNWLRLVQISIGCLAALFESALYSADTTIEEIIAAIKRRPAVETCRVHWIEKHTFEVGSQISPDLVQLHAGPDTTPAELKLGIPIEKQVLDIRRELTVDGSRVRYLTQKVAASTERRGLLELGSYLSAFDGKTCRTLTRYPAGMATGRITVDTKNCDTPSRELMPLLLALRPLEPGVSGLNPEYSNIVNQSVLIGDSDCVELEYRGRRFWLDRAKSFAVIRLQDVYQTTLVSYRNDPENRWLPYGWETEYTDGNKKAKQTWFARITSHDLHPKLTETSFNIEFPEGARVYRESDGESFVVAPDGKLQQIERKNIRKRRKAAPKPLT